MSTFAWKGENLRLLVDNEPAPIAFWERRPSGDSLVPYDDYYAADMEKYAGKEVTLPFEFRANAIHGMPDWPGRVAALDDIQFSTIPEPNTWALLALGGAVLWFVQVRSPGFSRWRARSTRRVG